MTQDATHLDLIEGLAKAATPGEWQVFQTEHPWRIPEREWNGETIPEKHGTHVERCIGTAWTDVQIKGPYPVVSTAYGIGDDKPVTFVNINEENAAYIAALDPTTVLALITRIRELEEALDKLRSYSVDIEAGRINYRPLDHIAVADAALQRKTP